MLDRDGYPHGVPCWIDTAQPDPEAATAFYGGVFGWEFEDRLPPQAPGRYLVARKDGLTVAAITSQDATTPPAPTWDTSIWVDDVDAAAAAVADAGGAVLAGPEDVGPPGGDRAGRFATCTDPQGARFLLWQAGTNRGAQRVNADGSWNFSELSTDDTAAAAAFYGQVFGWEVDEPDEEMGAALVRLPGYGDALELREPGLRERQASVGVPAGFEDAVAWLQPLPAERVPTGEGAHWSVTFAVDDCDGTVERVTQRGGTVLAPPLDVGVVRTATVRDPQGAVFVVSSYHPERHTGDGR